MPVADTKKVQSLVNTVGQQMEIIRAAVTVIEDTKVLFQIANPNVTGTPLDGKTVRLNTAAAALRVEVDTSIWIELIADIVPSHRGKALE